MLFKGHNGTSAREFLIASSPPGGLHSPATNAEDLWTHLLRPGPREAPIRPSVTAAGEIKGWKSRWAKNRLGSRNGERYSRDSWDLHSFTLRGPHESQSIGSLDPRKVTARCSPQAQVRQCRAPGDPGGRAHSGGRRFVLRPLRGGTGSQGGQ